MTALQVVAIAGAGALAAGSGCVVSRRLLPLALPAQTLGMSLIGFALPVTASIGHADSVIDLTIWGIVALIVQIAVYYLVRIPVPDVSQRIENGEIAPAIWLGTASITAGMLNAASMSV